MLGLLDLLVVVLELAWVLSGLIRAMPSPLESSACTKFLQTHNQNSKPIPTPSAWPLIHSFITRDTPYLVAAAAAAAAAVLVHHPGPTCVYP